MTDEQLARLRTHRSNISRYRRLLETHLTQHERAFIERRMSEEQALFDGLAATILPIVQSLQDPPTHEAA